MSNSNIEKYDFECFEKEHLPFTMIPNQVIQKMPAKKMKAGFLWVFLQSLSPSWEINKSHITKHFEISDTTYERWMSWLNTVGLIEYRQERNSNGTFGKWKLVVLNGTKFNLSSNSCRSVNFDGVETDRSVILPLNGEAVATANDGHINTTSLQNQEFNKNAREGARETGQNLVSESSSTLSSDEIKSPPAETNSEGKDMSIDLNFDPTEPYYLQDSSQSVDRSLCTQSIGQQLANADCVLIKQYNLKPYDLATWERFVSIYPRLSNLAKAKQQWFHDGCHLIADEIISNLQDQIKRDKSFKDGYIPSVYNYILDKRYQDEAYEVKKSHFDHTDTSWMNKRDIFDD